MGVGVPPVPCPCVLVVSSSATVNKVSLPVKVAGVAESLDPPVGVPPAPETSLGVRVVDVSSEGGPRSWFGLAPERTVVVEVRNTGLAQTGRGVLKVTFGKGENPDQEAGSAEFDPLMPGESVELTVPFRLDSFSYGTYTINGEVYATNATGTFSTQTSVTPWGWIVLGLLVLQGGFILVRNWLRRRRQTASLAEEVSPDLVADDGELVGSP